MQTKKQGESIEVTRAYHTGDMNEYRAIVAMNLQDKTAIVYFANSRNGHILADQIIAPNVELADGLSAFFQEWGFAREILAGSKIGLISEPTRENGKFYVRCSKDGVQINVIGLDPQRYPENPTIPWGMLPDDFPKRDSDIINSKNKFLPTLLLEAARFIKIGEYIGSRSDVNNKPKAIQPAQTNAEVLGSSKKDLPKSQASSSNAPKPKPNQSWLKSGSKTVSTAKKSAASSEPPNAPEGQTQASSLTPRGLSMVPTPPGANKKSKE